ncbi:MAG: metallophosphoesterase [Clostridia bacterium]|nr:metallophosphoesterase [Clostridia bacterium]
MDFNLLVIDDLLTSERREVYKKVLSPKFKLPYIDDPDYDVTKIREILATDKNIHGYLFDVNLQEWRVNIQSLLKTLCDNRKDAVVFLVSSDWEEDQGKLFNYLNEIRNNSDIMIDGLFKWQNFKEIYDSSEASSFNNIINTIHTRLVNYYLSKTASLNISENQKLTLLHLSDLQFGDDNQMFPQYNTIYNFLDRENLIPDLLILSGDIAYSGKAREYKLAEKWLIEFTKRLWPGNNANISKRILIVPGNHDFNFDACAGNYYEYKFSKNAYEQRSVQENENQELGLYNFKRFAYEMTKDETWILNKENYFYVNNMFLHLGVCFLHIDTISMINDIGKHIGERVSISDNYESLLNQQISPNRGKRDIYTIILSHFSPQRYGWGADDAAKKTVWRKMTDIIDTMKANLYLYGHEHKYSRQFLNCREGRYTDKLASIGAASLFMNNKKREDDYTRGFCVYELEREDSVVRRVKVNPVVIQNNRIDFEKDEFTIEPKDIVY